eukprot:1190607-Prorocentrum_minimum.AAC.1
MQKEIKKLLALGQTHSSEIKPEGPAGLTQQKPKQKDPFIGLGDLAGASNSNAAHVIKKLKTSEKQGVAKSCDKQGGDSNSEKQGGTMSSKKPSGKISERQSDKSSENQGGSRSTEAQGGIKGSEKQGGNRGDKLSGNECSNSGLPAVHAPPDGSISSSSERVRSPASPTHSPAYQTGSPAGPAHSPAYQTGSPA